jgi:hypothetical protein
MISAPDAMMPAIVAMISRDRRVRSAPHATIVAPVVYEVRRSIGSGPEIDASIIDLHPIRSAPDGIHHLAPAAASTLRHTVASHGCSSRGFPRGR